MDIHHIIKNDDDRLFIISPECIIVFTGDSIADEKPFIRIGNSLALTPRVIPLIENIIITDLITGNPAREQYNIDPRHLSSNRYIGSKYTVKRYLEFQKLFSLDLHNAAIVDIEKDIPHLSKEQIISDRDAFMGVFYTDSNFKILHNQKTILNLKDIHLEYPGDVLVHNKLAEQSKMSRYSGCGFAAVSDCIMFYKNGAFSLIGMPSPYYSDFAHLQIDPAAIRDVIITKSSTMPLVPIIKWKHAITGRLRVFFNNDEEVKLIQKLFNQCTIHHKPSASIMCDNPEGILIQNINTSRNYIITVKNVKPIVKDITIVHIQDSSAIMQAIETEAHLYIIDYHIYKKASMLLSNISPVAIIHPDSNAVRIKDILYCPAPHQYDVRCYNDASKLLADMLPFCTKEASAALQSNDFVHLEKITAQELSPILLFNILQTLRAILHSTANRDDYKQIEKLIYKLQRRSIIGNDPGYAYTIMLCNRYAYMVCGHTEAANDFPFEVIEKLDSAILPHSDSLPQLCSRIIVDRKRLDMLLDVFYAKNTAIVREATSIEKAINKRKERHSEVQQIDLKLITKEKLRKHLAVIKKAVLGLLAVMACAVLIYGSYYAITLYMQKQESQRQLRYIEYLTEKYTIHISDRDIYHYANDVAVKNGYDRLAIHSLKEKSPHWIFPGNTFVLLDGETVIVKTGDTLWGISENKLFLMNIAFYTLIDQLEKKIDKGTPDDELAQRAKKAAFTETHKKTIELLMRHMHGNAVNPQK